MSEETYDIPNPEDFPSIKTNTQEPFEQPQKKHLFITYNSSEWESQGDVEQVLECINALFGTETQIVIVPDDFSLLNRDEVEEMLNEALKDKP